MNHRQDRGIGPRLFPLLLAALVALAGCRETGVREDDASPTAAETSSDSLSTITVLDPNYLRSDVRGLESPFRAHPYIAAPDLWIEEDEL